jgi:GntR family transcriptional repressor for pyruvate dehydrogenase complex
MEFLVSDPGSDTDNGHAYERIAGQLRSAILSRATPPGARLPKENELAAIFGVSRATVREALRSLAAEDLITTRKGATGGSFVAEPSIEQLSDRLRAGLSMLTPTSAISLEQFMELRRFLEISASRVAATRRTSEEVAILSSAVPSRLDSLSEEEHYHHNRDFHFVLAEMCHNPLLLLAAEPVFLVLQTCLDRTKMQAGFHRTVSRHHRAIARAVHDQAGDLAAELMAEHLAWLEPCYRRVWREPPTSDG